MEHVVIAVGQTYERSTGVVYTVVKVEQTAYTYGWDGGWRSRPCPRVELMAVTPTERAGEVIHDTIPTGVMAHYGYVRLV